jgi:hypothetical protein
LPVYYHQERRSSHKLPGKVGKKTQAHGIIWTYLEELEFAAEKAL